MDIEELRKRVIIHSSGIPAVRLSSEEYRNLRDCTPVRIWLDYERAAAIDQSGGARSTHDLRAVVCGIGILTSDEAETEYGLAVIARGLP